MKIFTFRKRIFIITLILFLLVFNACTTIQFRAIDPPPPASKLRVAIVNITGDGGKYGYSVPHKKWSDNMFKRVSEYLRDTGIYEVVPQKDVNYAVGTLELNVDEYWWLKNDRALLKQYGKALYADYVMIFKRDGSRSHTYYYDMTFINLENGKSYSVSDHFINVGSYELNEEFCYSTMYPRMYAKLFSEIKGDLLATAMRKGRLMPADETKKPVEDETGKALALPSSALAIKKLPDKTPATDKTRLIVYDFNADEQLQVVSLILSDALREELFKLGFFSLVNRENLVQVMQELNLRQSGLVDEKQVSKIGKWLSANEAVTGRFSQFGNAFILQTKRIDVTTMTTIGFGSLKCIIGHEEELLAGLPELARKIAGAK